MPDDLPVFGVIVVASNRHRSSWTGDESHRRRAHDVAVHGESVNLVGAVAGAPIQAKLGRAIRWDARRSEFLWVDSEAGLAHRARLIRGKDLQLVCTYHLPGRPGSLTPVADHEGWLVTLDRGIHLLRADGSTLEVATAAAPGAKLNEAACDRRGRLWVCSSADDQVSPIGGLYRMERNGEIELVVDALVSPGGLGWNPDGTTMYVADSGSRRVLAFAYDPDQGVLGPRRVLLSFDGADGAPDGLCVDRWGDLWIAMFGDHSVRRYTSDGVLLAVHRVPAAQVTSCAFGGHGLRSLFVTTGTEGWDDAQRAADPGAGLLYRLDAETPGSSASPYRPERNWWALAAPGVSTGSAGGGLGYEIVVGGGHGSMIETVLPGFEVTEVRGRRVHLVGTIVDQAALPGVLLRLQDLHLDVLDVHRLTDR